MAKIVNFVLAVTLTLSLGIFGTLTFGQTPTRNLDREYSKAMFQLGEKKISAYIADTEENKSLGLMHIKHLPPNTGMLFVFNEQRELSFWMKNTLIPLSIGFFDKVGLLVDHQEMQPGLSLLSLDVPVYHSRKPAQFALEMPASWFMKNTSRSKKIVLKRIGETSSPVLNTRLGVASQSQSRDQSRHSSSSK